MNRKFWSKVNIGKSDECWNYKEGKFSNGYDEAPFHRAKISANTIKFIRRMKGKYSRRHMAKICRVNDNAIYRIWNSNKYPCIEGFYA